MRHLLVSVCVLVIAGLCFAEPPATAPTTKPAEATLKIVSVRVNRINPDLQKKFRNRYSSDGNPGVQMQLMLTLNGQQLLPLGRDAVNIDTFVDDTYQNLVGQQRDYYGPTVNTISEDGTTLLFPVNTNKTPADDAERVFVRGSIAARVAKGEPKVVSAKVKLKLGEQFAAGPFKGNVRSMNESGPNNVNVSLNLTGGEAGSVRNVRVLSSAGGVLQERVDARNDNYNERANTTFTLYIPSGNEELVLEFSYYEKIDTVKIPFEAQVDIGQTKVGPIEAGQPAAKADRRRPWPPPADDRVELAPHRPGFSPATQPAATAQPKIERPSVDLFSLTLGKPSTEEESSAKWQNTPSPTLRPRGFTLARLLLSVPDASILTILPTDLTLTGFSDDKTAKIDAGISANYLSNYSRSNIAQVTRDGQQALVTLPIDAPVTPGATKATIVGSIKATVGRSEKVVPSRPLELKVGEKFTAGPYQITLTDVRQPPPQSIDYPSDNGYTLVYTIKGPIKQLRLLELGQTRQMAAGFSGYYNQDAPTDETAIQFMMPQLPDKPTMSVKYFDKVETVTLPFEVSTTLGL